MDRYLYGYLSLHIGENRDSLEVFVFSPFFGRIKLLNNLKKKKKKKTMLIWHFYVIFNMFGTYVMYIDIGWDQDNDYDDGESSNGDYYK